MLADYVKALKGLSALVDLTIVHIGLQAVQDYKKEHYDTYNRRLAECSLSIGTLENDLKDLNSRIRMLEDKKLVYRPEVEMLQSGIREQLRNVGRSGEVRILCELLEITKPAWRNAVEGYLNTQRFYLITEPEDFDLALSVYHRLRQQKKIYGVHRLAY
jgi:chromosome segregation ATPase